MPLLALPNPPAPPSPPNAQVADWATLTWIGGDGVAWDLSTPHADDDGSNIFALAGVQGLGLPPRTITPDVSPRGGTAVRYVYRGPRLITLPVFLEAPDHTSLEAMRRAWAASMESTDVSTGAAGTLIVTQPDGSQRRIDAYYQDGVDQDPGNYSHADVQAITLYCPNPYFYDPDMVVVDRSYYAAAASFLAPFITVSTSKTLGDSIVNNPGTIVAYPTWTITGPMTLLTATNVATGESFILDPNWAGGGSLVAGAQVTISTDPPTVHGPGGVNWVGALNWPGAQLWGLLPGDNEVVFTATGSAAGTDISLAFHARYATA